MSLNNKQILELLETANALGKCCDLVVIQPSAKNCAMRRMNGEKHKNKQAVELLEAANALGKCLDLVVVQCSSKW